MEGPVLYERKESALRSRSARTPERHFAFVRAPLERYGVRGEAPTRAVALEATLVPAATFFTDANPRPEEFTADGSLDEEHPENGKNFPLWKKAAVIILDFFMYVSVFILISPIPLGWALIPINLSLLTIVIGRKHAERHLAKIVKEWKSALWYGTFSDMWVPQFLEKPWVRASLNFLEVVSRPLRRLAKEFVEEMKKGLTVAWELMRPKRKKKDFRESRDFDPKGPEKKEDA